MPVWLIFALLAVGLLLLWGEFFLPGGILGIVGGGMILVSIIMIFIEFGPLWGGLVSLAVLLTIFLLLRHWMRSFDRSFIGKRMMLNSEVGDDENYESLSHLVGQEGKTVSPLMPSGVALIDGVRRNVVAESASMDRDVPVRVVKVDGIKVVVRALEDVTS